MLEFKTVLVRGGFNVQSLMQIYVKDTMFFNIGYQVTLSYLLIYHYEILSIEQAAPKSRSEYTTLNKVQHPRAGQNIPPSTKLK